MHFRIYVCTYKCFIFTIDNDDDYDDDDDNNNKIKCLIMEINF